MSPTPFGAFWRDSHLSRCHGRDSAFRRPDLFRLRLQMLAPRALIRIETSGSQHLVMTSDCLTSVTALAVRRPGEPPRLHQYGPTDTALPRQMPPPPKYALGLQNQRTIDFDTLAGERAS